MPAPDLVTAELTLTGRITTASNATFLGSIGDVVVVYKPIAGAVPIVSATAVPALLLGAAKLGWLDAEQALLLAMAVIILRLASLGWVVGHLRQQRASIRTFLSGMLLALAGIAAATLKWWLTH